MNKPYHIKCMMTLTLTGWHATQPRLVFADVRHCSAVENGELLPPGAAMHSFRRKHCAGYPGICAS